MEEKKIEFEITNLVVKTYNKIALWVNNDYATDNQKSDALKIVSQDIVQCALDELLKGIDVSTNTEITRGGVKVGDYTAIKDEESFNVEEKNIFDKLFDKK